MAEKKPAVEYNWLSDNCGLKVSNICLGTGNFGKANKWYAKPGHLNKEESFAVLNRYAELGGNFLDTANMYTNGEAEEILGSWLRSRDRSSVVVATKVFCQPDGADDSMPNALGLSRGSIMYNIEQSLKRLQTDYVDLYYMHCWDKGVKVEETLRTFDDLVRAGKIRYVGLSNFTGSLLQKVVDFSEFMGLTQIATLEQQYNLISRGSDIEVVPTCRREGVSLIPYCPLQGGVLAGKFKRDDPNTAATLSGTRLGWVSEKPSERAFIMPSVDSMKQDDNFWKLMDAVEAISKKHGKTASQVSLRWLLQKDYIPSVIVGVKNIQQLEENMAAGAGWKLTDEEMKQLDDVSEYSGLAPKFPYQTIETMNKMWRRNRQK